MIAEFNISSLIGLSCCLYFAWQQRIICILLSSHSHTIKIVNVHLLERFIVIIAFVFPFFLPPMVVGNGIFLFFFFTYLCLMHRIDSLYIFICILHHFVFCAKHHALHWRIVNHRFIIISFFFFSLLLLETTLINSTSPHRTTASS